MVFLSVTKAAMLLCIALIINDRTTTCTIERVPTIPIQIINYHCSFSPFSVRANDTVSSLYNNIVNNCQRTPSTCSVLDISIIFEGVILLNFQNDHRKVTDIGMTETLNNIQIIRKPEYVALLEMVTDTNNIGNIPWFERAIRCLFDPSAIHCRTISQFGNGLKCDHNGHLIEVDLSHLNLSGPIHLESLPQTVRSLDLSFNDLNPLHFNELRGKSLEKLNVEHNRRCHIKTTWHLPIRELQVSTNQIWPKIVESNTKILQIIRWLQRQEILRVLVLDKVPLSRHRMIMPHHFRMLRVIAGVTNKEVIPWYQQYVNGRNVLRSQSSGLGVIYYRKHKARGKYFFDLSGLGLEGHIDLGSLPENVMKVDLSYNNLSSITFSGHGNGGYNVRDLNLQNNKNLRIDLSQINVSSRSCCLYRAYQITVSSNQLLLNTGVKVQEMIQKWAQSSRLKTVVVHDKVMTVYPTYRFQ